MKRVKISGALPLPRDNRRLIHRLRNPPDHAVSRKLVRRRIRHDGQSAPGVTMACVNRKDLQSLAHTRLAEAKLLAGAGRPDGAYYLAGYAVECALKACIAKATQRHQFPDKKTVDASHTHNFEGSAQGC